MKAPSLSEETVRVKSGWYLLSAGGGGGGAKAVAVTVFWQEEVRSPLFLSRSCVSLTGSFPRPNRLAVGF